MYSYGSYTTFQIDANFGAPSTMLEMLLYSRPGVIELLPALPSAWARSGRVTGIGARGGFEVDLAWRDGKVTRAVITASAGPGRRCAPGPGSASSPCGPAGRSRSRQVEEQPPEKM